jgi:glutathione synthase/RimK-type ligase-like ATP-grasp enzyme
MPRTTAAVRLQNAEPLDESVVMLGDRLIKRWKIPVNQTLTLCFGTLQTGVRVISVARSAEMRVHSRLAERLGFSRGAKLCLRYRPSSKMLVAGPLIGVLVNRANSLSADRPFGSITAFCRELTEACAKYGASVYFFTPADLSDVKREIPGWAYDGQWNRRTLPVPDVIYNRLTSRVLENSSNVQHFFEEVKSTGATSIFNERYLNKSEVFEALQTVPELKAYLPETGSFRSMRQLRTFCSKYRTVFVKPILNSLGKGIVRITRGSGSSFICQFNNPVGIKQIAYPSFPKMASALKNRVRSNLNQIQQGLTLIEIKERPVDFRVLAQRNGTGEWSCTSAVGRVAAANNFVSNIARGGTLVSVPEAAAGSNLAAGQRVSLGTRLKTAAVDIAKGLSERIDAHYAELGIDLAVEPNGKVWLLEVNSKPSKDDKTSVDAEKIRPSVRRVVEYAQFLAKF